MQENVKPSIVKKRCQKNKDENRFSINKEEKKREKERTKERKEEDCEEGKKNIIMRTCQ